MASGLECAWQAWARAWDQGYVRDSMFQHVGEDFMAIAGGAVVGIAGGMALIFVGQVGGAAVGAALGAYFSAGNPVAAAATAQLVSTIGRTIAIGILQLLGLLFLVEYVGQHIGESGGYAVAAYDLCINQAPAYDGVLYDTTIDLAARMIAESIGVFFSLCVSALAVYITHKKVQGSANVENMAELVNSKLVQSSNGLIKWLLPRLSEWRMKTRPAGRAGLRVIEGGLPSDAVTPLMAAIKSIKEILPKVVDAKSNTMLVRSIRQLHQALMDQGFRLIKAEAYGPDGGHQLFYSKGNVLIRFKTKGDARGPRANQPHMSAAFNDGRGLDWQNDMGKFTGQGKLVAKVITEANETKPLAPTDFQGNPHRFVLIPTEFDIKAVDAWASQTHFNAPPNFDLTGMEAIVNSAAP